MQVYPIQQRSFYHELALLFLLKGSFTLRNGHGAGSVSKVLTEQTQESEFRSPASTEKLDVPVKSTLQERGRQLLGTCCQPV